MAYYEPNVQLRESPVVPASTAVLFIDCQNYNCHREGAIYRHYSAEQKEVGDGPRSGPGRGGRPDVHTLDLSGQYHTNHGASMSLPFHLVEAGGAAPNDEPALQP